MFNRGVRSLVIVLLSLIAGTPLQGQEALRFHLDIERSEYLPGFPIHATMTVTNSGPSEIQPPSGAMILRVRPEGRPSFIVPSGIAEEPLMLMPPEGSLPSKLAPGETISFDFSLGATLGAEFLRDERLWIPGRYLVDLAILDGSVPQWQLLDVDAFPGVFRTNSVPVEIITPSGNDMVAWAMLLDSGVLRMGVISEQSKTARKLWKEMPQSRYSPYVGRLIWPRTEAERSELWPEIIKMDQDGHLRDDMRIIWALIDFKKAEFDLDHARSDPADALQRADDARARLVDLTKNARSGELRLKASQRLESLSSREYMVERANRTQGP